MKKINDLKESIALSLDATNTNLYPHFDFLLRDLWEFGADPAVMANLIRKNGLADELETGLDLGCGKGAVSIHLAMEFGVKMLGIDAYHPFVEDGMQRIRQLQLDDLCNLDVGDIRQNLSNLPISDIIILGSIGPVLGDLTLTLQKISPILKKPGYVLIDEAFTDNHPKYYSKTKLLGEIETSGYRVMDEYIYSKTEIEESNKYIYKCIHNRAQQLMQKYPNRHKVFQDYLDNQIRENEQLENKLTCITWLLKKQP